VRRLRQVRVTVTQEYVVTFDVDQTTIEAVRNHFDRSCELAIETVMEAQNQGPVLEAEIEVGGYNVELGEQHTLSATEQLERTVRQEAEMAQIRATLDRNRAGMVGQILRNTREQRMRQPIGDE
jgi:translation elongation factor EF-Tu-like GTPase